MSEIFIEDLIKEEMKKNKSFMVAMWLTTIAHEMRWKYHECVSLIEDEETRSEMIGKSLTGSWDSIVRNISRCNKELNERIINEELRWKGGNINEIIRDLIGEVQNERKTNDKI